jgi:hypothetical protein
VPIMAGPNVRFQVRAVPNLHISAHNLACPASCRDVQAAYVEEVTQAGPAVYRCGPATPPT